MSFKEIYNIAWSKDIVGLQDQVNTLLADGWTASGGIAFNPQEGIYLQAVSLSAEEQERKEQEEAIRRWYKDHRTA